MKGSTKDAFLDRLYYNCSKPGGFSGINAFMRVIRKDKKMGLSFSENYVKKWMEKQDVYSRHHPVRKRFPRNRMKVYTIDEVWMADLIDMSALNTFNGGNNFILTVIDALSKFAWAVVLPSKHALGVAAAFEKIFKSGRVPMRLITDRGKEFLNTSVKSLLKKHDIQLTPSTSDHKAFLVERWNRTLKEKMWKYFTAFGTFKYLDRLDNFVAAYNNSYHRSIKMTPTSVTPDTFKKAWRNLYGLDWPGYQPDKKTPVFRYQNGDNVRVSRIKGPFDKGYLPGFTAEIFTIVKRIPRCPPVYKLVDDDDEPLDGIFYEPELVRVNPKNGSKSYK